MCGTIWFTCFHILMTRIGNLLGEKNARRAGVASNTSIIMAFTVGCIWRYARSFLNLSCAIQNGDDRSKHTDDNIGLIYFCLMNSTMFIGFRHSWAYLFNNDPGRYLFRRFIRVISSWNLKQRLLNSSRLFYLSWAFFKSLMDGVQSPPVSFVPRVNRYLHFTGIFLDQTPEQIYL